MVFSSFAFIWMFLPPALFVYYGAARFSVRAANWALALLGYAFYAWSIPKFLVLMWATTLIDWLLGLVIAGNSFRFWRLHRAELEPLPPAGARSRLQVTAVVCSVVLNLASLGFFKYAGFAHEAVQELARALFGASSFADHPTLRIALPLGISFYTFQSLSYIVDVYRGDARPMTRFGDFACFVSMFPHLVAGPILRFAFLAKQLEYREITRLKIVRGIALFCVGLGKKVLLANSVGALADVCFGSHGITTAQAWAGALAYALQVYFDFSGYSDMAVGLGLMLGFVFARNFDSPYRADSLTDFWRRWHISLSSWLRDYLYVPLGGSKHGTRRTYLNLIVTMLLGGLWHGAAWTFVIWGGIHGVGLAAERAGGGKLLHALPRAVRIGLVFFVVTNAWVFFRSENLPAALEYLSAMYGGSDGGLHSGLISSLAMTPLSLVGMALGAAVVWLGMDAWRLLAVQSYNPFIYFIF